MAKDKKEDVAKGFAGLESLVADSKTLDKKGLEKKEEEESKIGETGDQSTVKKDDVPVKSETKKKSDIKPKSEVKTSKKSEKKKTPPASERDQNLEDDSDGLYEAGVSFKSVVDSNLGYDEFKMILGTEWKEDALDNNVSMIRVSLKHHQVLDALSTNFGIGKTAVLHNVLNYMRYCDWDHIQKILKENSSIEM